MKIYLLFLIQSLGTPSVFCDDQCTRPTELKLKEEYCFTTEVEIVDRVVQRSKNVLNFARKKLGIPVDNEQELKKCQYYMCILRQLHLLNANDYPSYENIQEWSEKNVIYSQELEFIEQLNKCHDALTNATVQEINFYAHQLESENAQEDLNTESKAGEQSTCEIAAEYIHCLSRQKQCPVFQYP